MQRMLLVFGHHQQIRQINGLVFFCFVLCGCFFFFLTQIDSAQQQQRGMEKTKNSDRLPVEANTGLAEPNMEQHLEAFKDKTPTQDSKHNLKRNCDSLRYLM